VKRISRYVTKKESYKEEVLERCDFSLTGCSGKKIKERKKALPARSTVVGNKLLL
jgi:hypothetical protein